MTLRRIGPTDPAIPAVHALILAAFADMAGRIDPPSSILSMGPGDLDDLARAGAGWVVEDPEPVACLFASPRPEGLYLGKLAVARSHRGRGLSRMLIAAATAEAQHRGLRELTLKTRVELIENHDTFVRLGFHEAAREAHPGYDRPTTVTFVRPLDRDSRRG